jgi:4-amino-4-deoxy-L-arabinose transferase-like glycosyltransferase
MFPFLLVPLNRLSPVTLAVLLCVLSFSAFCWRLGEGPIYRTMEGREALVMQEIARTGNWVLPLRNGETIPSKPPLLHWIAVAVARLTGGVSEWSVRFPTALFSALSVGLTCLLGYRLAGREVGVLAALLLLTMPGFVEMSREGWVDPALAFFVLAALASFSSMYENEHWRGWRSLAFYLSLAGAALSKGPVGYILPTLVILAYLAVQRQLSRLRALLSLPGILLALGLPLTWYLLAFAQEGWAFVHKQVLQENLVRFTAGSGKRIPSGAFFLLPALLDGFPWSVLFCLGLWNFARHAPVREKGVFPLVWWFAILVFFSVSAGKRDVYLLPAYPAMALFAAEWGWPLAPVQARPAPAWLRTGLRIAALGMSVLILTGMLSAASGRLTVDSVWLDRLLGQDKWNNVALYIRFLSQYPVYGVCLFVLLCAGGVWVVYAATDGRWHTALWLILASLLLSTVGLYPFTRAYSKEFKAFTGFAATIKRTVGPNDPLWFYTPESYSSEFDEFSQVYFYLDRRVPLAPCAQQPDFGRCTPGYYLLRATHWQKLRATPYAHLVLDSVDSAGPDAETRLVLIRLGSKFTAGRAQAELGHEVRKREPTHTQGPGCTASYLQVQAARWSPTLHTSKALFPVARAHPRLFRRG